MEDVAAIDWNQVVGKEARGARDDGDFGEMLEAGRHYVVTQRGILEKEKFYIPKYLVYGFDGHTLWFNITEDQLEQFKRELPPAYEEYAPYKSQSAPADIEDRVPRVDNRQKDAAL